MIDVNVNTIVLTTGLVISLGTKCQIENGKYVKETTTTRSMSKKHSRRPPMGL